MKHINLNGIWQLTSRQPCERNNRNLISGNTGEFPF
jgi:hypothetical protein